jgi:hypothetical protein
MINAQFKKQLITDFYKAQLYATSKYETEKNIKKHIIRSIASVTDTSDLLLFRKVNGIIGAKNDLKIDNFFMSVFLQNYNDSISIWANLFKFYYFSKFNWEKFDNKDYIQNIKNMFSKKSLFADIMESLYRENYLK